MWHRVEDLRDEGCMDGQNGRHFLLCESAGIVVGLVRMLHFDAYCHCSTSLALQYQVLRFDACTDEAGLHQQSVAVSQ